MTHDDSLPGTTETAQIDELLDTVKSKYDVRFEPLTVGDVTLEFLQISDMEALVERLSAEAGQGGLTLPLWARIWPTAILLSYYLRRLKPVDDSGTPKRLLELGAGVGVCGLFAAAMGFDVTLTDIHPDAVLFMRINILKNGLSDHARAFRADFATDRLGCRFDGIIGSEILYLEDLHRPLVKFLTAHLALHPDAEVLLAREFHRKSSAFSRRAAKEFHIDDKILGYRETSTEGDARGGERQLAIITRMRARKHA